MEEKFKKELEYIITEMISYMGKIDEELVKSAYNLGYEAHKNQFRKSGEPYFIHPVAVAKILLELKLDQSSIIAAILHDVVEDTEIGLDVIEEQFGSDVAFLVDGLTKLKKLKFVNKDKLQVENQRKMILTMSQDIRVVLIKLSDRLHNMRTLNFMKRERQVSIAKETLEIYSPIAHRLGVFNIKWELEDLSFKYLNPEDYKMVVEAINMKRSEREGYVNGMIEEIDHALRDVNINCDITGRPKSFYSIYNKMKKKDYDLDEIYDLNAIRIIVDTVKECYISLGIIHMLYKPIPRRFKDYIAMPKPNMYQSIHTTLIGYNGEPFEIQIRTMEMHKVSEYGIAAHFMYKEGSSFSNKEITKANTFLEQIAELQEHVSDAGDFMDSLKTDLFTGRIYVFTPKGDVYELKKGSIPLDFAYRVHSDIGNRYCGARINGHIVSIDYELKNGDIIEILTNKNTKPSLDWLKIVATKTAHYKIKSFFKKINREEKIEKGSALFAKELKKREIPQRYITNKVKDEIISKYGMSSIDDLYSALFDEGYNINAVMEYIIDLIRGEDESFEPLELPIKPPSRPYGKLTHGIRVAGFDDVEIRISKCCNPLPGDDVVGYISRGKGISIHRADCPNFKYLTLKDPHREVEVVFEEKEVRDLIANIEIEAFDRKGITPEIIKNLHMLSCEILELNSKVVNNIVKMKVKVGISNSKSLENVFVNLNKNPEIIDVRRVIPNKGRIKK